MVTLKLILFPAHTLGDDLHPDIIVVQLRFIYVKRFRLCPLSKWSYVATLNFLFGGEGRLNLRSVHQLQ